HEQELGRMKTQLVAMVSHEFNNALSVLGGVTLLLKEDEAEPMSAQRAQYYTVVESHLRSLALAARTLLEMGRHEAGRLSVKPRRMDLGTLARDCAARLEVLWARKGLDVRVEVPDGPLWVDADPDALGLVATNLIGNAVKYTPEKGRVTVGAALRGGEAELSVADSGIGIAKEDQERILSGYYRTEESKKTAKGFGVGLALASALLQAHGARLTVESEPGRGARFSFRLPPAAS
ncbi:MAG: HAMP domain-containing histidine kinase, partial [Elusimicrobia bacterium]|nr:HAMP domain-containing histidine kinase [Elusimicrobiota bacterium]